MVVGGGPAGSAAAACCALHGLRTALVERERFPRERPGETLHPLVEGVFERLGVRERVLARKPVRNAATWMDWSGEAILKPYGTTTPPQLGFQLPGIELDLMLLDRAREVGVDIRQPCAASTPIVEEGRVCGIVAAATAVRARWVIDAAGRRHWIARHLHTPVVRTSPRLLAHFGYARGSCPARDDAPLFRADGGGWTWTARIGDGRYHWTRLSWGRMRGVPPPPDEFSGLEPEGRTRAIDVTWRCVRSASGPGYWCIGDAAAVVDPAGSHGVIRALMAGITVADLCAGVSAGTFPEQAARAGYGEWVNSGFSRDTADLRAKYSAVAGGNLWNAPDSLNADSARRR